MSSLARDVDGVASDLDAAVGAAVAAGLEVVDRLTKQVIAVLDRCVGTAEHALSDHADLPGRAFIADYTSLLTKHRDEAELRLSRQRTRLSTFNLVLFGRTGAGKSSLIEALSSGDGQPISEGQSDWTTDVRDVRWRSTRLVDTPGIAGWGRTMSRDDLEARAEKAVADADVVILCFDTQSQQAGEFSKIAEWVSRYGKPVVAVLNSRNPRWRQPNKVGRQSTRRDLSRSVHEHASNIRDELALIDLPAVPIVAIHTKRAAFARTRDPYAGPDAGSRERQRDEYGPERLLAWSNLPALELLLSEGLERYASPLRLGMLHEQARGLLLESKAAAQGQHEQTSVLAEQLERGINDVLGLVGRPVDRDLTKHLAKLEKLRGRFGTAGPGELLSHARLRIGAGLEPARRDALRRADHLIDTSFETRSDLGPEDFEREVLNPARTEAEAIARSVGEDLQRHLVQRLELVADDVRADLSAAIRSFEGATTTAGQLARRVGVALEVGGSLFGIGSSGFLLVAALANSWNPAGWVLGAVAGVSIVGGLAFSFIGGKLRKRGIRDRVSSLSAARARARRTVHDTFDHLERAISEDLARILSRAAHERLAGDVAQATALRRVSQAAQTTVDDLQKAIDDLPAATDTSHLLTQVARDVQRRRFRGEPTAERLLWLGEDWCNDPEGLSEVDGEAEVAVVTERGDLTDHAPLLDRIRSITEAAGSIPPPGAGAEWLTATVGELAGDRAALEALAPVRGLVNDTPPRVVLAGDYSTGKSSFVKRLLVDAGLGVPDTLDVAAQPKTATVEAFRWGGWEIVDTPGFQSSHRDHAAAAHEAVIGASLLVVLFNPNLVVGAEADLRSVLFGDRAAGRVGKLARTLFVINRSDELGIDPREDVAGYQNLCRRKELELAQALGARHTEIGAAHPAVSAEQILCVASDPYGLVGDRGDVTRADYDRHRDWDGMDAVHLALTGTMSLARNAVDLRVLEGGALILGDLAAARRTRLALLEATVRQRRLLLLDLDACLSAGRALHGAARDRLVTTCVSFVAALFDDVAGTTDDDELQATRVDQLRDWANNPELQQLFEEWSNRFVRDQEEWREATSARVEARLTSVAFAAAFPTSDTVLDVDHLAVEQGAKVQGAVGGAKRLAEGAANASREGVTKVAHALGHKFRPWGATKLTAKVNVAGGALGIALGTIEIYSTVRSVQRESDEERSADDQRRASLREVRQKAEAYFDSTEPDAPGQAMAEAIDRVKQIRDVEGAQLDDDETRAAVLDGQIGRCEQQMRNALEQLERSEP